jgi:hypothetical protein
MDETAVGFQRWGALALSIFWLAFGAAMALPLYDTSMWSLIGVEIMCLGSLAYYLNRYRQAGRPATR